MGGHRGTNYKLLTRMENAGLSGCLKKANYLETYTSLLQQLRNAHGEEAAMDLIVGGQSKTIGVLEHSLLTTAGLQPSDTIVDVGCGSGRLSSRLAAAHAGLFVGTDIIVDAVEYAKRKAARADWQFHVAGKPPLPIPSEHADFICFLSVFTHLLDEDIYEYLGEARRIAKIGGKIVFSFLDFAVPSHWTIFEQTLANKAPDAVLNKFIDKDAIRAWAEHLNLAVVAIHDGSADWIQLLEDINYIDGRKASGLTSFGQSIAILERQEQ